MEWENDEIPTDVAEALFEAHSPMMYKAALKITKSDEDAKDAMQNVFARVIQNWPSSRFMKDPKAYLYRAARNEARSLVRSHRQRDEREVDVDSIRIQVAEVDLHGDDRMRRVRSAMAKMKPRFVEILHLFYNEEYDCSEIAAMQGRLSATVFSDLCRARAKLRQLIAAEENAE